MTQAIGRAVAAALLAALLGARGWPSSTRGIPASRSNSIAMSREICRASIPPSATKPPVSPSRGPERTSCCGCRDSIADGPGRSTSASAAAGRCRRTIPRSRFSPTACVDDGADDRGVPGRPRRDPAPRGTPRTDARPAQLEDVRARPGDPRPLGVTLDRLSLTPDGIVLVPRPALYASSVSSAAMGAALALLGRDGGIGDRRRGPRERRRGGDPRPRLRSLHRLSRHGDRARDLDRAGAGRPLAGRPVPAPSSAPQHRALRRRVFRRRALPEAARAAAPEHAGGRRDVPRAPLPGRARRQPLLHVDRAWRLFVSVSAGPLRVRRRLSPAWSGVARATWRSCGSSPAPSTPSPG